MEEVVVVVMAIGMTFALIVRVASPGNRALPKTFVSQTHQHCSSFSPVPLERSLLSTTSPTLSSNPTPIGRSWIIHWNLTMPRIRGKLRRGAVWYTTESRRKRKENFEKAMAMAARRRRERPRTPPMAVVKEVIPEGGLESPPEHTLFMVPENWNPRSHFGSVSIPQTASGTRNHRDISVERYYSPCYVEEEVPPEPTRGAEGHKTQEAKAATSEEFMDSHRPEQPPSVDWGYLNLVFEMRNLLEDQVFCIARLEQRLNMFFAAHSRATPKKQCPTCSRAYSFLARWRHSAVDDNHPGSEVI
jgi:hypothetical protein